MLTKNQQDLFNRRIYGNFVDDDGNICVDIDFVDYSTISTKYKNNNVIMSGWMSPHIDHECGESESWTFKVLAVRYDDNPVLVHTLSNGNIVGNKIKEGCHYTFLYKNTHALVPHYIAKAVVEEQSWDIKTLLVWQDARETGGYTEKSQMAWYFINVQNFDLIPNR